MILGCKGSPTEPEEDNRVRGRLAGVVTITPNATPDAFAARKVLVYDETKTNLLFRVDIDSTGLYFIDLVPGKYVVDLQKSGADTSNDVPATVEIFQRNVTKLDIAIDSGG